jgi:REP element-mobilizing transposase RayT
MALVHTLRYRQRNLPHWEVEGAGYFITIRCGDSLPARAIERLRELRERPARNPSEENLTMGSSQRKLFLTLEKYLDAGFGACPLNQPTVAEIIQSELAALAEWQISAPHYSIMPNHCHALLMPFDLRSHPLSAVMKRIKGRTAKRIRDAIGGSGPFWQSEWFDRWIRSSEEWNRLVGYIRNNPVKAGLAARWELHPWTR